MLAHARAVRCYTIESEPKKKMVILRTQAAIGVFHERQVQNQWMSGENNMRTKLVILMLCRMEFKYISFYSSTLSSSSCTQSSLYAKHLRRSESHFVNHI